MTPPPRPSHLLSVVPTFLLTLCLAAPARAAAGPPASASRYFQWFNTTATCYGERNGRGTMYGACGYGNLVQQGMGLMSAALSVRLFRGGAVCGSCWELECVRSNTRGVCRRGRRVTVTATNLCPNGSEGGWCNEPRGHFDLSCPAWDALASKPQAGIFDAIARRVPCTRRGGIGISAAGNMWWVQFLFFNTAGSGDVAVAEVSVDGGRRWTSLSRDWGMRWVFNGPGLNGRRISFRLTDSVTGRKVVLLNALPANWRVGLTYRTQINM